MNFIFNRTDKNFEAAALSDARCDLLIAKLKRVRVTAAILVGLVILAAALFFGALALGDPFSSPVWQWMLTFGPDGSLVHTRDIEFGGLFAAGLLVGGTGLAMRTDHHVKLLLIARALRHSTKDH